MADPINPASGRTASHVCIYWETPSDNSDIPAPGRCGAGSVFSSSLISCYNDKACNGAGTCRDCSAYNPGGLLFTHKDATTKYGEQYLWVWNDDQKKYLPVRKLNADEAADLTNVSISSPYSYKVTTQNFAGLQLPMNLAVYNLRAKFKKCCNWDGPPVEFSKSRAGTLYATVFGTGSKYAFPYLTQDESGNYIYVNTLNKCILGATTAEWTTPFTTTNPHAYGCNGAKAECPYYTGPKWTYCVDSKLEHGDSISAAQIMELRYYSADWQSMVNPYEEWNKRFKDPVIWAWTGGFADISSDETPTSSDSPMVKKVHVDTFTTEEPQILIDQPTRVDLGTPVSTTSTTFPTAIKELSTNAGVVRIDWPVSEENSRFIFRTFRIGQNQLFVFVETPYPSEVYAVNITKHDQGARTDSDFMEYMSSQYEEDLYLGQTFGIGGLVACTVELEYYPQLNTIKIFTRDPTSSTGEYLTDTVSIIHQFTHAVVMQTKGEDRAGQRDIKPYIDRFENVHLEADVRVLKGPLTLHNVLWDSAAGNKITTYPTYTIVENESQSNWDTVGCNGIIVNFDDWRCNPVHPWEVSGTYDNKTMGLYINRSNNPQATNSIVPLEVVYKSSKGLGIPADSVLLKPTISLSTALDKTKDVIFATYRVTEYNQCPVTSTNVVKLKYPDYAQHYATELPVSITINSQRDSFSVDGSFLAVTKTGTGSGGAIETDKIYNLDSVQEEIALRLKNSEDTAVYSFPTGGVQDDDINSSSSIFETAKSNFEGKYDGYKFADGKPVTLKNTCDKLEEIKTHEGEYKFLVIMADDRGKPIGVKRVYLMLQSAVAECRDVEIYYEWNMNLRPWYIINSLSLLAMHSEPMQRGDLEGIETYRPKCGDHSETLLADHTQGEPGPMWYPFDKCRIPTYHEDHPNAVVKCSNYVEGFDSNASKRWAYWERMRGPDRMYTWIASTIRLTGCYYREVSYSYTTEGAQNFAGYTRIRSSHPSGPFSKDREAIHINRHFIKRNKKVRQEYVRRLEDGDDISVAWADDYSQIAFTPGGVELVGASSETPIWVHLSDGMSVVKRTTSEVEHPFSHYLMSSCGGIAYNETFDGERFSIKDVLSERDLTSTAVRDTNGTLVYQPGETLSLDPTELSSDIYTVFSDKNISWAWLERPKDPVRGSTPINGITLYPPSDFTPSGQNESIPALKKDRSLAAYTEEGSYKLVYTPPTFDATGTLTAYPTLSFAGGPERLLNWYTGEWADTGTVYDLNFYQTQSNFAGKFYMFGKGSGGSSLLMDNTGVHKFIGAITNDGTEYYYTVRGVGINTKVLPQELPYELSDYIYEDPTAMLGLSKAQESLLAGKNTVLYVDLTGYFYVNEIKMTFIYGPGQDNEGNSVRYDIPVIDIFAVNSTNNLVLTSSTSYEYTSTSEIQETYGDGESVYTYKGTTYKEKSYTVGSFAKAIRIEFSSLRGDSRVDLYKLELLYRKPTQKEEDVYVYERKVTVSRANSGLPDYRNLLYYYSRTIPDFGYSLTNQFTDDASYPSIKWVNKNVKDVILEYEYTDPTGTRFAYKPEVIPEAQPGFVEHDDLSRSYANSINICTKSRTLVSRAHVDDNPHRITSGGETVVNSSNVADNETASSECTAGVGNLKLGEESQECLYNDAKKLTSSLRSEYTWFWHPDEIDFWENTVRIPITNITRTLVLTSTVAPMHKLWEHEYFGCTSDHSTPYHDGRLHAIIPWQAAGHRVYTGNPAFNETCVNVVIFKIGEHVGEENWGTASYTELKSGTTWPYMTYKDSAFYIESGNIEKRGTYMGGTIGGAGLDFWVQQSQFAHGETAPQLLDQQELEESIASSRSEASRAEAGYSNFHYNQ